MKPTAREKYQLLNRLQEKLPEQKVGLVPADAFFARKIELPEGLGGDDRTAFIQLSLEGNSPFPMEQLAWGYLEDAKAPFAYAYATPKARLRRLEIDQLEKYHQIFPGFISLFRDPTDARTVRFLSQNGVLSAIFLPGGHPVPEQVVSRRIAGDLLTDDVQLEARELLLAGLDVEGWTCEDGLWLGEGIDISANGDLIFKHRHISKATPLGLKAHVLDLDEHTLWSSDLRDLDYAGTESKVRQRSSLIWRALTYAGWAAAILLVLQLLTFGLSGFNAFRERQIRQLEPDAVRVQNKLTLAARLTQSTEEDLKPFLLMESINTLRPDSIFYDKVRSSSYNTIEIEGKSTEGVTPVNAFADSIGQLSCVNSVENNSQTRNNQTSFELLISFSALPPEPEGGFMIPEEPAGAGTDNDPDQG
jgi:hypothetical protein